MARTQGRRVLGSRHRQDRGVQRPHGQGEARRASVEGEADARSIHRELLAAIESFSDAEWNAKASYRTPNNRRRTLGALLGSLLAGEGGAFRHNESHVRDLAAFARSVPER
jgi:hypothetical protein